MRKLYAATMLLVLSAANASGQTVLKFDDVAGASTSGGGVLLTNQYAAAGITFVGQAYAFCLDRPGTDCSNTSWGLGAPGSAAVARGTEKAGLYFASGTPIMNSSVGFTTGFSFFYSNPFAVNAVFEVWSGLNATGSLLASFVAGASSNGENSTECVFQAAYCPYIAGGVAFAGTAQSVRFTGNTSQITYDDITFGSADPGGVSTVPEPSTYALMAGGLAVLGAAARRRRRA